MRCGAVRCGGGACPEWWCLSRDARTGRQDRTPGRFSPARDRNRNRSNNWGRESDKNPSPAPVRRRHWALLTARCLLFTATGHRTIHSIAHYPWPITRCCMSVHTYIPTANPPPTTRVCARISTPHPPHTTPYHPIPRHTTHTLLPTCPRKNRIIHMPAHRPCLTYCRRPGPFPTPSQLCSPAPNLEARARARARARCFGLDSKPSCCSSRRARRVPRCWTAGCCWPLLDLDRDRRCSLVTEPGPLARRATLLANLPRTRPSVPVCWGKR